MIDQEEEKRKRMRMIGAYLTIPFVLAVPPIIGWFIGTWLDKQFESSPFMSYFLLILGFIAGGKEFYRIIKKYGNDGV